MQSVNVLLALAGVLLLSVASPGPNFLIVTSTAIASRSAGIMAGLGLAAASGTWALIAIAGLSLIVTHVTWIGAVLRIACAWYCAMALLASHPTVRRTLIRRKAALDTVAGVLLVGVGGRMLAGG